MMNINKVILTTIISLGSFSMAFSQSHRTGSLIASDTIIYVTPEQLEDGVRSVAQAIVDNRESPQENSQQQDILTKDNIQLLKYQMLLSALGMNLAPRNVQPAVQPQVIQTPNVSSSNTNPNISARLDRLESLIYMLLQRQGVKTAPVTNNIITPSRYNNAETPKVIISKKSVVDKDYITNEHLKKIDSLVNLKRIDSLINRCDSVLLEIPDINKKLSLLSDTIEVTDNTNVVSCNVAADTITLVTPVLSDFKRQVFFVLGEDILTSTARETLDNVVSILNKYPNLKLSVIGYASANGNRDFNLHLSAKRTTKVFGYLVSKGISPNRLYAENGGIDANASIMSEARRVDLVAVK